MVDTEVLDRNAAKPLYAQLTAILRDEIIDRDIGSRFYGDKELCRRYSVSLPVVRGALSSLVKDGYLERIASKGTFIKKNKVPTSKPESLTIGFIGHLSKYNPHIESLKGIQKLAGENGHRITVSENQMDDITDVALMVDLIRNMSENVDGVIWQSSVVEELNEVSNLMDDLAKRVVLINTQSFSENISSVVAGYEIGSFNMTRHLIALGYKRIGFIGGLKSRKAARMRYSGFEKAMVSSALKIDDDLVRKFTSGFIYKEIQDEIAEYLSKKDLPEAIFCVTDDVAFSVIESLKRRGLNVPDDIAVVGFDDDLMAIKSRPMLTTVRQPYLEMGRLAMKVLLDQLNGSLEPGCKYTVPAPLIVRESCGAKIRSRK